MQLAESSASPITVLIGDKPLAIPRFTRRDRKAWASLLDAQRLAEATKGLTPEERFKYVAFFSIPPATPGEVWGKLVTYEGQEHVIRVCLQKLGAEWTEEKIDQFLEANADSDLELLARQLASVSRPAPQAPPTTPPTSTMADEQGADGDEGGEATGGEGGDEANPT